jgi:lipopolysaccharide export system protein LptC
MSELTSPPVPARRREIKIRQDRGEAAFDEARRRTRLVGRLRIILPAVAILAIAGFVVGRELMPRGAVFSMSGLNLDAKSLTIEKPRVSGFKGTSQSYDLSAARAVQDLSNPKMVRLEEIAGRFGVETDGSAAMTAATGIYDSDAETLVLKDGVSVKTTTGYELSLMEAALDFRQKTLISANPIVIKTGDGEIRANSVRVSDSGKTIAFGNGVSVTYMPQSGDGIAATQDEAHP